jgi:hypothetical protein
MEFRNLSPRLLTKVYTRGCVSRMKTAACSHRCVSAITKFHVAPSHLVHVFACPGVDIRSRVSLLKLPRFALVRAPLNRDIRESAIDQLRVHTVSTREACSARSGLADRMFGFYRWYETGTDGTSKYRKAIVGTVATLANETSALKAAQALRIDPN